jgi:hypothetical protein
VWGLIVSLQRNISRGVNHGGPCDAAEPALGDFLPDEVEKRVEAMLAKMTLEEKITLIAGSNDFYIRSLPRLRLPALRMSDGPMGVHDYGETRPATHRSRLGFPSKHSR